MSESEEFDRDDYDDDPPRRLLSTLWFRTLLVVLVLGVIAVLAAPSLIDVVSPRTGGSVTSAPAPPPESASTPATPAAPPAESTVAPPAPTAPAAPPAQPAIVSQAVPTAPPPSPAAPAVAIPRATPEPRAPRTALKPRGATAAAPAETGGGPYFVQVGAFKDPEAARRLAARLREQQYHVDESIRGGSLAPPAPSTAVPAPDRYEVFVAGARPDDIAGLLKPGKSVPEPVAGGVVLRPALPLADALALSRDLAGDGRRVQVRRAGARPAPAPEAETYHRVRVGGFPDRAAAEAARRELEGKGYQSFIARGDQ